MTDLEVEIEALASRAVDGVEDAGAARMAKGHVRRRFAEALVRQVAARHGVSMDAVVRKHRSRQKHHVVMARAQAAFMLHDAGYSYPEIARLMAMSHHSQAIRSHQLWVDHLAGRLEPVDEATGRRALALIRRYGLTVTQAAARLDVSPVKLKGRIGTIRDKDRAAAQKNAEEGADR